MAALKYRDPASGNWVALPAPPAALVPGADEVTIAHQPAPSLSSLELWVDLDSGPSGATGVWSTYTPTWRSSAAIVPGTGGLSEGHWMRLAPYLLVIRFILIWGSSGGNGGSGQHYVGLPPGFTGAYEQSIPVRYWAPGSGVWLGVGNQLSPTELSLEAPAAAGNVAMASVSTSVNPGVPNGWYPNGNAIGQGFFRTAEP